MKKDFYTYQPDLMSEIEFLLSPDDNLAQLVTDAKNLESFVRIEIKELGPGFKQRGIKFRVNLIVRNERDAMWMKLKWD